MSDQEKLPRRGPRSLAEKLDELAQSARTRIDKLRLREARLMAELGKVRTELRTARAELDKVAGPSAEHPTTPNTGEADKTPPPEVPFS